MDLRKLRRNAFWFGAAAAAIGVAALYSMVVLKKQNRVAALRQQIQSLTGQLESHLADPAKPPAGRPDIQAVLEERQRLLDRLEKTVEFYRQYDARFEAWFPDLGLAPEASPPVGVFHSKYLVRQQELDRRLGFTEFDPQNVRGYQTPDADYLATQAANPTAAMKDLQKMYWVRERFAKSFEPMLAADRDLPAEKRTVRVRALAWHRDFYKRNPVPGGPGGRRTGDQPFNWTKENFPGAPRGGSNVAFTLPGKLGGAYLFMANLELLLHDLPAFLRSFLTVESFSQGEDATPPMLVELMGLEIMPAETAPYEGKVRVPAQDSQDAKARKVEEARKQLRPKPVRVWLTARILDPDGPTLAKFVEETRNSAQ